MKFDKYSPGIHTVGNQGQEFASGHQLIGHTGLPNSAIRPTEQRALFDALHQLSGTHDRKLLSVVTLLQFLSLGLRHSSSLRLSLLSLLTNTLPGPSASEVTTLRRYTNLFIIIIIIIIITASSRMHRRAVSRLPQTALRPKYCGLHTSPRTLASCHTITKL